MVVGWVCCSRLIRTRITICSGSFLLPLPELDIPELHHQLTYWSLKYQGVERLNLQAVSCRPMFECEMTFPTPYTVFDLETLDGFKGAVNRWMFSWVEFPSVFHGAGACGAAKAIYEQFCFSHSGLQCAAGFNNNNNLITLWWPATQHVTEIFY